MPLNRKTAVIGCAIRAPATDTSKSLEELLYDVAQEALADAGLAISDIDGLVVAANDQMDGRAISIMAASGSVGGVDRDILSTPSAGEHAFVMGVLRVATGLYRTHLVLSWSPTEASPIREVERLGNDPYFHRRLPLDETAAFALQASALSARVPEAEKAAKAIAAKHVTSGSDVKRWPLEAGMLAPPVAGVVALVLASEDFVSERKSPKAAWVRGMGWATEPSFLGDRNLATAPALEAAYGQACDEAGLLKSKPEIDVAEISDATPYQRLIVLEGLGLSARATWLEDIKSGALEKGGRCPVNPSGGIQAANAIFCTGLIRIAEAANQVRGSAGKHQIKNARTALAHAASGFAMQYQTVVVFGRDR